MAHRHGGLRPQHRDLSHAQTMKTEELNAKQQNIVTVAAFTASGDLPKLSEALDEGLDTGLTISEIKEVLWQIYAYAGFPRSLNGIGTFMCVLETREKKGIKDPPGKESSPLPTNKSSVELGTENQTRLIGAPATGAYITFGPRDDRQSNLSPFIFIMQYISATREAAFLRTIEFSAQRIVCAIAPAGAVLSIVRHLPKFTASYFPKRNA